MQKCCVLIYKQIVTLALNQLASRQLHVRVWDDCVPDHFIKNFCFCFKKWPCKILHFDTFSNKFWLLLLTSWLEDNFMWKHKNVCWYFKKITIDHATMFHVHIQTNCDLLLTSWLADNFVWKHKNFCWYFKNMTIDHTKMFHVHIETNYDLLLTSWLAHFVWKQKLIVHIWQCTLFLEN